MRRTIRRRGASDEDADINLTPMLDVVFIMLIFFIVTATFIKQAGITVARPEALTAEQKPTVSMLVAISLNGEIWIDKKRNPNPNRNPNPGPRLNHRLHADSTNGVRVRPA